MTDQRPPGPPNGCQKYHGVPGCRCQVRATKDQPHPGAHHCNEHDRYWPDRVTDPAAATALALHQSRLNHPRAFGASGCICDIEVRPAGVVGGALDVDRLADAIHAWHNPEARRPSCRPAGPCRKEADAIAREYAALREAGKEPSA